MKTTLVIYGFLIAGLLIWVFMQSRSIAELNAKITALTPATPSAPANPAGDSKAGKTSSATAGDWVGELQSKIKKVDLEFTT